MAAGEEVEAFDWLCGEVLLLGKTTYLLDWIHVTGVETFLLTGRMDGSLKGALGLLRFMSDFLLGYMRSSYNRTYWALGRWMDSWLGCVCFDLMITPCCW